MTAIIEGGTMKFIFLIWLVLLTSFLCAQAQMNVHTTTGTTTINLNEITDITFSQGTIMEDMIFVQGGTFNNGTSNVTVSSFYLDKYEVKQSEYQLVMGNNPSQFSNVTNGPVEQVNWYSIIEYCNKRSMNEGLTPCYSYSTYGTDPMNWPTYWNSANENHISISCNWGANGYRLPSEAEWEFAAHGGTQTHNYTYSGSNTLGDVAWYFLNSGMVTHPVGIKAANELGLFDMNGNVWEFVWDIYEDYSNEPQNNPHGPVTGDYRVVRGGGWDDIATNCLLTLRATSEPTMYGHNVGFRVCRTTP